MGNLIKHSSAAQFAQAVQRIENPVKIRNGTATVSVEAPAPDESRSLGEFLRRLCGR